MQEVRVFVDGTIPSSEETAKSPYAIPTALLGLDQEALPVASAPESAQTEPEPVTEEAEMAEEAGLPQEESAAEEPADEEAQEPAQEEQGEDA